MRGLSLLALIAVSVCGSSVRADEAVPAYLGLADRFAPEIIYAHDEPNLPTSVEWFSARASMSIHDQGCKPVHLQVGPVRWDVLQTAAYVSPCGGRTIKAFGTRSASRSHTYVIEDVAEQNKRGSTSTEDWPVYIHAFRNTLGGWSLQYWCFYAFNTGMSVLGIELGYHGGDWEMFQVDTDPGGIPRSVAMTGHSHVDIFPWSAVTLTDGTHPVVHAERGGHEMHLTATNSPPYVRRDTWRGSSVTGVVGPHGLEPPSPAGPLVDLGTRLEPIVAFLNYSGVWGSLGMTPFSSGYWGPPFNETGMPNSGFLNAWCFQMSDQLQAANGRRECYPDDMQ
jgi:hypothetical protein